MTASIIGRDIKGNPVAIDPAMLRWRPAVYGIAIREKQLLVLENPRSGQYELPGGGLELHETRTDGLIREMYEECNVQIEVGDLIATDEQFFESPGGNYWHTLRFFYRVTVTGGASLRTLDPHETSGNPHWHPLTTLSADNIFTHWSVIENLTD